MRVIHIFVIIIAFYCNFIVSFQVLDHSCIINKNSNNNNNSNTEILNHLNKTSNNNTNNDINDISSHIPLTNKYNEQYKNGITMGWFGINIIQNVIRKFISVIITDPDVLNVISKGLSFIVWGFIILSGLGTLGFDTKPILSLVSVLGITIGLASKDILTNTFAGILIVLTSPIKRGWIINVSGYRGKVLSVNTRYVKLLSLKDKSEILVPLSLVYASAITIEHKE